MDNLLDGLNPEQLSAVTGKPGPMLILAGAGSGKTRVLTHKIAYLIKEKNVSPFNILAITFTNKAAKEMHSRLETLCGADTNQMWVKTFHSMCVAILRKNIELLGYKSGFNIYDDTDQKTIVKDCIKSLNIDEANFPVKSCLYFISDAKNKLIPPEEFLNAYGNDYLMSLRQKVYSMYQDQLFLNNAVDFDDLILLTVRLFTECPDVLSYYRNKFRYVFVDEYQDTNYAQYQLVSLLASEHENICVVGDDDQSIYKFRGADIKNILNFEKEFKNTEIIRLEQNYRSTDKILDCANAVIKNNTGRKGKRLWTKNISDNKPVLCACDSEYDEADFIVREINKNKAIYNLSDMAILFRTNNQSRVLEERLRYAGIAHKLLSGLRFYDRKEIKDIIAYLKLILNPDDDISLRRCINEPKRGIGKTSMDRVSQLAQNSGKSMFNCIKTSDELKSKSADKMISFVNLIEELQDEIKDYTVSEFVEKVIHKSGYYESLVSQNDIESKGRLENLGELISGAKSFEETSEEPTLLNYVDSISLISDIDNYDEEQDAVTLMTIHTAKGLEFPVVFIVGIEDGLFPSERSKQEPDGIEEERRLCYVAITRAKQKLYLSYSKNRRVFGKTERHNPSLFLKEIPSDCMEDVTPKPYKQSISFETKEKTGFVPYSYTKPQAPVADRTFNYKVGQRVSHKKFGEGTILLVQPVGNDMRLEVSFDGIGTKNLMAVYAKLEIIK